MAIAIGNFYGPRSAETQIFAGGGALVSGGYLLGNHISGAGSSEPKSAPTIGDSSVWWCCFEELSVQYDSGGTGSEIRLIQLSMFGSVTLDVFAVRQASGNFLVRLKDTGTTLDTGTTEYAYHATFHTCRITITGAQWVVEMGGTVECNAGNAAVPDNWGIGTGGGGGSSILFVRSQGVTYTGGADGNDRPSVNNIVRWLRPNGNGTDNQLLGDYLGWRDWAEDSGTHDGDTTIQRAPDAAGTYYDTSQMDTFTITNTLRAVMHLSISRNDDTTKSLSIGGVIHDGTTRLVTFLLAYQSTSWTPQKRVHATAPGGGAWDQTELDQLEVGMELRSSGTTQTRTTAVGAEALDLALDAGDPPPISFIYRHPAIRPLLVR